MEKRFTPREGGVRVEKREDGSQVLIGVGAVFYREGDDSTEYQITRTIVERIHPEAFDRALADQDDARGLFNHDSNQVLGRVSAGTMRLTKDADGLRYEIDLPDTQTGRDVAQLVDRGDVTGSSFAFMPEAVEWTEEEDRDIRTIKSVRLFDTGPVTYPAYEGTSVGLRSMGEPEEAINENDDWRRDMGRRRARAMDARARQVEVETLEAAKRATGAL